MDRAMLDACGWSDISTACDLVLDYEINEAAWGRKKTLPLDAGDSLGSSI